ncbi:type IV toxin-antitoxin system AbiEi family antitoxin [Lysobacter korlensis]|uniref:Type IV toxin-antitoxin system AbiEi family antitoxin n=1 Tax=Lysobacter korlensis TaxID=553636 RepID=A0ABV6RM21_9GAMM
MQDRPLAITADDLPLAELLAARLDGDVFTLNLSFFAIDEFETPALRAASLRPHTPANLTAERDTAAWVWGARTTPPRVHEFCSGMGTRGRPGGPLAMTVREVVIDGAEIRELSGLRVTDPERTLLDLLRFATVFDPVVAARLAELAGADRAGCAEALGSRRNLPFRRRALVRLAEIF